MSEIFSEAYPKKMHALLLDICEKRSLARSDNLLFVAKLLKEINPADCHGAIGPGVPFNSYIVSKRLDLCSVDCREARRPSKRDNVNPPRHIVYIFEDHYSFDLLPEDDGEIEEYESRFDRNDEVIAYYALGYLLENYDGKLSLENLCAALDQAECWFMKLAIRAEAIF